MLLGPESERERKRTFLLNKDPGSFFFWWGREDGEEHLKYTSKSPKRHFIIKGEWRRFRGRLKPWAPRCGGTRTSGSLVITCFSASDLR